jgi:hypothetical protein
MCIIQSLVMIIRAIFIDVRIFVFGGEAQDYNVQVVVVFEDLLEFVECGDGVDFVGLEGGGRPWLVWMGGRLENLLHRCVLCVVCTWLLKIAFSCQEVFFWCLRRSGKDLGSLGREILPTDRLLNPQTTKLSEGAS